MLPRIADKESCSVKVVADSVSPAGKRITTLECRYWRAIHAEVMTHRAFARNAASSRAIPYYGKSPKCTVAMMKREPFIPKYIGAEQKGMQSGEQLSPDQLDEARMIIASMLENVMIGTDRLYALGVHKSIINRYLEPWSYITTLITATEWNNFYALRIHPKAEKHFNELAVSMAQAMLHSKPTQLKVGQLHLPYINSKDWDEVHGISATLADAEKMIKKISSARSARVSYLTHDGKRDIAEDTGLFNKLEDPGDNVLHASPFEHVAICMASAEHQSGPFRGWKQYRKEFPNECVPG